MRRTVQLKKKTLESFGLCLALDIWIDVWIMEATLLSFSLFLLRPRSVAFLCISYGHYSWGSHCSSSSLQRVTTEKWFGFVLLCLLGTRSPNEPKEQRKGSLWSVWGVIHLLALSFSPKDAAGDAGGVHTATSHSLQILPLLGWRHRVSKHLHTGGHGPAEPAATERSLCAGTGWDLLAGGFFQQCSCNMLHARLQTFLGQLSRTWINSGYLYKPSTQCGLCEAWR